MEVPPPPQPIGKELVDFFGIRIKNVQSNTVHIPTSSNSRGAADGKQSKRLHHNRRHHHHQHGVHRPLKPEQQQQQQQPNVAAAYWPATEPAQGSLLSVIRAHERERLFVRSIVWTGTHLRLLNVHFERAKEHEEEDGGENRLEQQQGQARTALPRLDDEPVEEEGPDFARAARLLTSAADMQGKAMELILKHHNFRLPWNKRIHLYFNGRAMDRILTDGIFEAPSGRNLFYINFETIRTRRNKFVWRKYPVVHGRGNGPMNGYRTRKMRKLLPAVDTEDPYIAGLLIALAQQQRRLRGGMAVRNEERVGEEGEEVYGVGLPGSLARVVYFYRAWVPWSVLDRLETPRAAAEVKLGGDHSVGITYRAISLEKPLEGVRSLIGILQEKRLC